MYSITRLALFELLKGKQDWHVRNEHAFEHVQQALDLVSKPVEVRQKIKKEVIRECSKLKERWVMAYRVEKSFLEKNQAWLRESVTFSSKVSGEQPDQSQPETSSGRPSVEFSNSSDRSKRRKTETLRRNFSSEQLSFATGMTLRSAGKNVEAKLMDEALNTTPTRAKKISTAWKNSTSTVIQPYTPEEALALTIEANLSEADYQKIRMGAKERNVDIYPSIKRVRKARAECYPAEESIEVTERSSKVQLQPLLNHTVERILKCSKEVLDSLPTNTRTKLVLISKYGCDGSSNQSTYKQKSDQANLRDADLLMTCLVPLQLSTQQEDENDPARKIIVWQNPRPSSTRFCRPIKFEFIKETPEAVTKERQEISRQISDLVTTECTLRTKEESYTVAVEHKLCMSMIDGKVCNILTETASSQTCNLCGATPKQMNQIDIVSQRPVNTAAFEFGLSTLHAYIRFFEWMLHVSYRLEVKVWQVKNDLKEAVSARKLAIQNKFRTEVGLLVDVVKQGAGTTNDGNTARRFFKNPAQSARITGLNESLIARCDVLLRTMSCGYEVDVDAFHRFALETAKLYVSEYPWYYMPASVHKVLVHGADCIRACPLPIGMMSEEAQEARNKDFRHFRRDRARKCSRKATNEDVFHMMLVTSDPIISSLRKNPTKFSGSLSNDVVKLLKGPSIGGEHSETDSE